MVAGSRQSGSRDILTMTKTSPFIFCILPFALAGCFFATKSDFDNLQMQLIGARAGSNAADSVQRAYLVDMRRTVRSLNDSINALSKRVNAMRTANESDLAAMKEDISQLQDLSGQSERQLRDMRAAVDEKTSVPTTTSPADSSGAGAAAPVGGPGPAQTLQAGRHPLLKGG